MDSNVDEQSCDVLQCWLDNSLSARVLLAARIASGLIELRSLRSLVTV